MGKPSVAFKSGVGRTDTPSQDCNSARGLLSYLFLDQWKLELQFTEDVHTTLLLGNIFFSFISVGSEDIATKVAKNHHSFRSLSNFNF